MRRNTHTAYDETFHSGVNVIRGDNSSGKSTILNFIFYGLGGDLNRSDWSEHALRCTHVWLEVEFNGKPAVLRREVDQLSRSAMEIYGGRFEEAAEAPIEMWLKYPYSRGSKESFSQAIFRLLEMPDVAVEGTSSVTMHQVLRLLYADQMSSIEGLFRFEGYDPENLREAVGNLLCGAFDAEIYELQRSLKSKEKAYSEAVAELRSIFRVVGGEESLGLVWLEQKRKALLEERTQLLVEIEHAEEKLYSEQKSDKISLEASKRLYEDVRKLQVKMLDARSRVDSIELDLADSNEFISSLERRLRSLKDAESAAELVNVVHFSTCPACYAEVLEQGDDLHACQLCKTPLDTNRVNDRLVGHINDISIQLRQSKQLQEVREQRRDSARAEFEHLQEEWSVKSKELSALNARPTSKAKESIRRMHRKLGYVDKSIEDMDKQFKLANRIGDLSAKKANLDSDMQEIAVRIELLKKEQTTQLRRARKKIELETIALLKGDLSRQDSFEDPKRVDFSFAKNTITVDDHTYFSASSRVILKTSFLVGFLSAAIQDPSFRHPRFLMIDITEDKGMEVERSHNFQDQIVALSRGAISEHQVIFATAMPSKALEDDLFVGRFSTLKNGTLNFHS